MFSLFFSVLFTAFVLGLYLLKQDPLSLPFSQTPVPNASSAAVLGVQTKTSDCVVQGAFPDPACTPGAVFPNATKDDICVSGYSSTVRDVPEELKQTVYAEYGITQHTRGQYEIDHFISLELGGSNDISNLWPEAAEPQPGFHEKDVVENYLHDQVCSGKMTLQQAQTQIRTNWLNVYQSLLH